MTMTADATTGTTPPPIKSKVRIQALDLIRGMAILGILAVNADGFAAPMLASLNPATWPFPHEGWTAIAFWIVQAFFHEKFVTLFSMLFGVSLFLVGGELSERTRGKFLARRLVVLLALGLIHGFGIWWGDILTLYASAGAIMFFCRSLSARTLMIVGVLLYGIMTLQHAPLGALPFAPPEARAKAEAQLTPLPAAIAKRKARAEADLAEAKSSWAGAYRVNAKEYQRLLSGYPRLLPATLGLMMIGLSLFKSGFLAGRSSVRRYVVIAAVGGAGLTIVSWMAWRTVMMGAPVLGGEVLGRLLTPFVSLAYASVLILLLKAGAAAMLSPVAAAGRMAFTNYLTQSLIMTGIFYGGRGALMGQVDRPALWGIVLAIWALQLTWSPLWLKRFEMGPFEWIWRCLTVGRLLPIRKAAAGGQAAA